MAACIRKGGAKSRQQGALLVAGRTKAAAPATIGQQKLFAAGRASEARKTAAQVRAIQELFDSAPRDRAPETVLAFVALVPDALEFVEVVLDQVIQRGLPGASLPVDSLRTAFHIRSNRLPPL